MPITVNDLSYQYTDAAHSTTALSHVTFTIEEGSFFAIAGHTGSGKTTLVQHLNGLIPCTEGTITVDGHSLADKKERSIARALVGMVFQYPEYQLFAETVFDDIAFGPKNLKLPENDVKERVLKSMELVGLDPEQFREKSPFELSGGEKRRAALAGVLAMQPKYLVLDEPMAGLDPIGRQSILALLERLRSEFGTTIIMISHSMEDIARHATMLLVLDHGQIAYLDRPEIVFEHAEELFRLGLSVPQATYLGMLLKQKGFDVPKSANNAEALARWLKEKIDHA